MSQEEEINALIEQVEDFFIKEEYQKVIDLLSEEVLEKYKDVKLYNWCAWTYHCLGEINLSNELVQKVINISPNNSFTYLVKALNYDNEGKYDEAIDNFTKAIELDPNNAIAYYSRGSSWGKKDEYDNAILDFTKTIELNPDDASAYYNRGVSWYNKNEYDRAIADYSQTVYLNPTHNAVYNNRGVAWNKKGEYDKAIVDYTKSIELNSNDTSAYNNRGNSWNNKGEYDKAIADYNKLIELNSDDADAYNNRGVVWGDKGEYDKAIADYTKAIELKNDFIYPYRNRGVVKEKLNYNEEALNDYNAALKIDPTDIWANYYRDELYAKMGVPVKLDDAKADVTLYQIVNSVELLENENDKLTLIQNYKLRIEPIITKIRNYTSKINEIFGNEINEKLLAHYSNLKTADILTVKEGSKLRYSNAVFMNDPEEGKILIDCLNNLDGDSDAIKTAFYNVQREERTNFYLGSFLPVKDDHEDELLMWRTYGKDENRNEAAGCCLLIDFNFFDKSDGKHIAMSSDNDIGKNNIAHPLYKVIYYNKRTKKIEGDTEEVIAKQLKNLAKVLKELLERKDKVESENNKAIDKILYHSLSELRYFFKSADYYFENELRVIQFATHQDIVQIDKESNILPRRMFVESSKEIKPYLKKIILGPKVPHPERWMYLEEQMKRNGYPIELVQSNCQYQ